MTAIDSNREKSDTHEADQLGCGSRERRDDGVGWGEVGSRRTAVAANSNEELLFERFTCCVYLCQIVL